ncbi:MAG: protease complex subunit PrcB family protein [Bacteroidales bacterium]|jgi:hypothetical protein|nr:protease complex subunit PrcB family protein [Bacteroidales bacterium]
MKIQVLKLTAILLILVVILVSCKKEEKCMSFVTIAQGSLNVDVEEVSLQQGIVIKTQKEWEDLETIMDGMVNFSETEIDFDKYQIIAVFDKVRYSGIWSIDVISITEHSNKIVVKARAYSLSGSTSPTVISRPYHIVKMPISSKEIELRYI